MKKLRYYLSLLILIVALSACEKEFNDLTVKADEEKISLLKEKVSQYGIANYSGKSYQRFTELNTSLNWLHAKEQRDSDGMRIVRIPSGLETSYERNGKAGSRELVIYVLENEIKDAHVIDVITSVDYLGAYKNDVRICDIDFNSHSRIEGFTGEKLFYDLSLSLKERQLFEAGKITRRDVVSAKVRPNPNEVLSGGAKTVNAEHCKEWWLITTIFLLGWHYRSN